MRRLGFLLLLGLLLVHPAPVAEAQQCGPANPNCVIQGGTFSGIHVVVRNATSTNDSILNSDYFICAFNSGAAVTETLPPNPVLGLTFLVKDCNGQAATHNITVQATPISIDGGAQFVMIVNFQSAAFTYNGAQWSSN